jgi:hypothetical protein
MRWCKPAADALRLVRFPQECEMNMAMPARAAAASVPMSAACTKGIDLRNTLRIHCSPPADC